MTQFLALALVLSAAVTTPAAKFEKSVSAAPAAVSARVASPSAPAAVQPLPLASAPLSVPPAQPRVWKLQAAQSSLTYHVDHKLHHVSGTSKALEGKALLQPDGTLQLMVRAPVDSFDSGDANRDEHMHEVMESSKFPYVTLKGVAHVAMPAAFPATVKTTVEAELEFHGRKQREQVPVTLELRSPTEVRATGPLTLSLDRYQVERPSLLMMKIDDACRIDIDVTTREEAR